jgi:hypothetical protein
MKRNNKNIWLGIALVNLCIVAFLGMMLRSKILFSIPFIDFKNLLHTHSHFAFGGWITLAVMSLMVYEILPGLYSSLKIYKWLLGGVLLNALGMLLSFPFQGYGFFSILFSTLFIFVSYAFAVVFIRHLKRSFVSKTVKLLSIGALIYLVLSSVGPFTLAYLLATKSGNAVLYRDSIYTYLHLQYNGFFTLAVFALFINRVENYFTAAAIKRMHQFAHLLNLSVLPSMFLCYLWHYPNPFFRTIAAIGSVTMLASLLYFFMAMSLLKPYLSKLNSLVRGIGLMAMAAFVLKMVFQSMTLIHLVGALVFPNRPVIIGFLHMVLLSFITLYLLAHMIQVGHLRANSATRFAVFFFASAVTLNTVVLMLQGLTIMLQQNSTAFPKILWLISIALFAGTILLLIARINSIKLIRSNKKIFSLIRYSLMIK